VRWRGGRVRRTWGFPQVRGRHTYTSTPQTLRAQLCFSRVTHSRRASAPRTCGRSNVRAGLAMQRYKRTVAGAEDETKSVCRRTRLRLSAGPSNAPPAVRMTARERLADMTRTRHAVCLSGPPSLHVRTALLPPITRPCFTTRMHRSRLPFHPVLCCLPPLGGMISL